MTHRSLDEIRAWEDMRRARDEAEERAREVELAAGPWQLFLLVADRYRDKFGTVPDFWRIHPNSLTPLAAAMKCAMQAGRALTVDEASKITGCEPPPLGTVG